MLASNLRRYFPMYSICKLKIARVLLAIVVLLHSISFKTEFLPVGPLQLGSLDQIFTTEHVENSNMAKFETTDIKEQVYTTV